MHEFSIAEALIEQVDRHAPAAATVRTVNVAAGAMQMIEPEALRTAWAALTAGTRFDGSALNLTIHPPHRRCPDCGRDWTGGEMIEPCTCGCVRPQWVDAMLLRTESIEVDDDAPVSA